MKLYSLLCAAFVFSVCHAQTYTVKSGDSLGKIAQKHGMSTAELIKLNNITDPNKLAVGQKLKIKGSTPSSPSSPGSSNVNGKHKVVGGDTFYKLARKYGLSIAELKAANPNVDPSKLSIGQVLNIRKDSPSSSPQPIQPEVVTPQPVAPPQPVTEPQPESRQPQPANHAILRVVLQEPIEFKQLAAKYNMTPAEVNKLNGWTYDEREIFDTGSTIFVIKN